MPGVAARHALVPPIGRRMRSPFPERLVLSRAAIDRDHLGRDRPIADIVAEPDARAVLLHDRRALATADGALALVAAADAADAGLILYLGRTLEPRRGVPAGTPIVVAELDEAQAARHVAALPGADWSDLRRTGHSLDAHDAALFTAALGLANWHAVSGFSPRTGRATEPARAGWTRRDPESGTEFFPRTDPAIIVGVVDADDRLLLGSNAMWATNRFSLLAGFVEPGESLEAAVAREVHEESGLRVGDARYLGSQPWPFPASLMLGFMATVTEGTTIQPTPDGEEILALRWFTRAELGAAVAADEIVLPGPTSIARAIIEEWYGDAIDDGERTW